MANSGAVASPTYQPAMREITAITQAEQPVITTSFDHNYLTGEVVRLYIPSDHGMTQANEATGQITVTGDQTFTVDIDTTLFDSFVVPGATLQVAQVVPIAGISIYTATDNVLPSGNR